MCFVVDDSEFGEVCYSDEDAGLDGSVESMCSWLAETAK
jgi:hypothetical protein